MSNTTWVGEVTDASLAAFKEVCNMQSQVLESWRDNSIAWQKELRPGQSVLPNGAYITITEDGSGSTIEIRETGHHVQSLSANDNWEKIEMAGEGNSTDMA